MTQLTPQQTFEKQLEDRLRAEIGTLMPDDLQVIATRPKPKYTKEQIEVVRDFESFIVASPVKGEVLHIIKSYLNDFISEQGQ